MRYRKLGSSDLQVSEISLGSWLTFGVGVEAERARAVTDAAFDLGINFIDTANIYGRGAAETFLGDVLSGRPRDSYLLATKLYFPMTDQDRGLSRGQVEKQLDASLERLRTDYVDLYQCHRFDEETPLEETMQALTDAVRSGKVRYIGFSEWPADRIRAAVKMAGVEKFVSSQPQYSLLWREPEGEVIPLCAASGISQIVWSPLAQGVLTGKYKAGAPPPPGSRATSEAMGGFISRLMQNDVLEAVQRLKPLAEEAGLSLAQFALAWVLRERNVASAIVGASRPEQLAENAAASDADVDPALFAKAEALVLRCKRAEEGVADSVGLILVPWDSALRESRMGRGPGALMAAGLVSRLESQGVGCRVVEVEPEGRFLAEVATAFDLHRGVKAAVEAAAVGGWLPIALTGNCNTGVIGTLAAATEEEVGLFWFDAHSDAETPESSTSGFLDGMGFAILLGRCWDPMLKSIGGSPLDGRKAALVGAREVSHAASDLLHDCGVALVPPEDARGLPAREALAPAVRQLHAAGVRRVHVHIDLDVLDPDAVGPANDYALPGGVTTAQLLDLIDVILAEFELSSASLASYDPALDETGAVAAAGVEAIARLARG